MKEERARPPEAGTEPQPDPEPFLGYDGLDTAGVLDWIERADPELPALQAIGRYERRGRNRRSIVDVCDDRIRRLGEQA